VRKAIDVARPEHEASAQLKGVLPWRVLPMPGGTRARSTHRVLSSHDMQQVGRAEAGCSIRLSVFIDQQRKGDPRLVAKRPRILATAKSDGGYSSALLPECVLVSAQLRDMLPAENSPIVPQEHEHDWVGRPERAEPCLGAVAVRKHDVGEPAAERVDHAQRYPRRGEVVSKMVP